MNKKKINQDNQSNVFLNLEVGENDFEFSLSIESALEKTENELFLLNENIDSIKKIEPNCDKLDYILAASSGALCGVVNIFLVGKPGESFIGDITDKWFADRIKDFAKLCHPEHKEFESIELSIRFLEKIFKIPYDQTGLGDAGRIVFDLNAKNHHFKSLAHNPSLFGLFFSLLDQFSNTSHFVTDGQLIEIIKVDENWELQGKNIPSKIFCGVVNWMGHLISDSSGSQSSSKAGKRGMGIPSPLWTWMNDAIVLKAKLNLSVSDTDKAINQLALDIFEQGYDMRYQIAQAIPVFINEILVRFIYSIRRLFKYFSETEKEKRSIKLMLEKCEPFTNATVKRMLTVAHGSFCLVNTGDAVVQSLIVGEGSFDTKEFILNLNIIGIGRFAISLYGETKLAFSIYNAKRDANFALKEKNIVLNYIEGLKTLSFKYDDQLLLTFIDDFEKSDAYIKAFEKSIQLAKLRNVPTEKILIDKNDVDKYFGGK